MEDKNAPYALCTDSFGAQVWQATGVVSPSKIADWIQGFGFNKQANANSTDGVFRSQKLGKNFQPQGETALEKGWHYFSQLQAESGHWPGDYGGPLFLLPGLVFASHITQSAFADAEHELMKCYMLNHQNEDGGWGLHIQGGSTMFGTVLQYVALRLLGESANTPAMTKAGNWILQNGGATQIPSWGKFYLSVLGLYDWKGCNSLFPEMWLLPKWLPVHPAKYWCHTRMVYLPMAYCFSHKIVGELSPMILEIRQEIYAEPFDEIDWAKARNQCAETDLYYPQSPLLKLLNKALNLYEKSPVKLWRKKVQEFMLEYIYAEDEQTNYINIGPVNQVINSICVWHAYGANSIPFRKHRERWAEYLWLAEDGLKMQGYNGSQLWDTAFAYLALKESSTSSKFESVAKSALSFIDRTQVREEVNDHKQFFRHDSVGGWPFSTSPHGWPITDCTAEGLKIMLSAVEEGNYSKNELAERLKLSCNLLLSFQNTDGGWASYELTRGPKWLEWLNPSEVFGNIMIDYSYTECSSASLQALIKFNRIYPEYRSVEVKQAIQSGINYLLGQQKADGSWYGSWAICFTYGTWFGCEGLCAYVQTEDVQNKEAVKNALIRAARFLISKQQSDGGWGESFESSVQKKYISTTRSQAVNTAWALLTLLKVNEQFPSEDCQKSISRAVQFLESQQLPNGDFLQEHINGVFNHNCMISYTNYRNIFPLWALGRASLQQTSLSSKS